MNVSIFTNVVSSQTGIAVKDHNAVLEFIKNNKTAMEARSASNYSSIKKTLLSVTWAGVFPEQRNLTNLVNLSGLMYFDIDEDIDKSLLYEIPEVYAAWSSLSGKGVGFLIKVKGLNTTNYNSTYKAFCEKYEFNFDSLPDWTRLNIISYDPDIHINENCDEFEAVEPSKDLTVVIKKPIIESSDESKLENAFKYVNKSHSFVVGQRHRFTVSYFGTTNQLGVELDTAYAYLVDKGCYSNVTYKKGRDIYKRYSHQFNTK